MRPHQSVPRLSIDSALSRVVVRALPCLAALGFGFWMLARRQYILIDDAYISFRYASNLANGHGLVWNPGVPVEGYTCLSWVLMLSVIAATGIDLTVPAVVLSVLFGLGCLELMRRIAGSDESIRGTRWEIVPGMLLASLPPFAHAMTSGMEETCFAFLTVLGIHLLVRSRERRSLRFWAGLTFAAACLTRPEGALVAAVALVAELAMRPDRRQGLRELVVPALCVALTVTAHTAFRLVYYGYPFPNTFYAKVIVGGVTLERGAAHVAGFLLAGGWLMLFGYPRTDRASRIRPWLVHGYALAIAYGLYLLSIGGDHPRWYRFYVPLLPLTLLGVGERLRGWLDQRLPVPASKRSWVRVLAFSGACLLIGGVSLPFSEANEPIVGIIDLPTKKLMQDVDRFFAEVPEDSFCAVAAIGHVGYRHLGLHILDIWGLTDTHIAHLELKPSVKFGHDKQDDAYVAGMKPDYIYKFALPLPMPGYDLCWPSENPPAVVYRRAVPLLAAESRLGVPPGRLRRIEPPPACRPPRLLPAPALSAR
jgi:arabinofuranosyltransferase